jgi:hypothetical protein
VTDPYDESWDGYHVTQTSTDPATPDAGPMFPPGRYGRRRESAGRRRRWAVPTVALVIVAVMALITVKLYVQYGRDAFSPNVIGSSNITDSSITVTFTVTKGEGVGGSCTVAAYTYGDQQVGEAQVPVPRAGTQARITYTLATTAKAYIAEVPACQPNPN